MLDNKNIRDVPIVYQPIGYQLSFSLSVLVVEKKFCMCHVDAENDRVFLVLVQRTAKQCFRSSHQIYR